MGAWSSSSFGNDSACDWIGEFLREPGFEAVQRAFDAALVDGYLDSDEGTAAVAACEVVARLSGRWGTRNAYSEDLDRWVLANPATPTAPLRESALRALHRVVGSGSELAALWADSDSFEEWQAAIADLRVRVAGPP